jgi:hypothetical protein
MAAQGLEPTGLAHVREIAVSKLPKSTRTPGVHMAVVGEREGVEVTARDPEHARVPESLHATRARFGASLAMAELSVLAVSKGEELALGAEHARMPTARDADDLDRCETHHEARQRLSASLAVTELPKRA